MGSSTSRGKRYETALVALVVFVVVRGHCSAAETLLSSFEGDLSSTLGVDWQFAGVAHAFVAEGATQGSQALQITHTRTQSIPLRLVGDASTQLSTFYDNTQLRADFTVPETANFREAFFRLQVNGGAFTIDGADIILTPGATVAGVWDYEAEGVFDTLALLEPITNFSIQLGMRGPDLGSPVPPTSVTIVDNIRWFTPGLPGDFNEDNAVDAADYVVWRKNDGTNNPLPNDDGLGVPIGTGHFELWIANYGNTASGAASGQSIAVPEPSSVLLAGTYCLILLYRMRRR